MASPPPPAAFPSVLGGFDARRTPVLQTDVLVIGAGLAGCAAALTAARAGRSVLCVTKSAFGDSNTAWAKGGVAANLRPDDSESLHTKDTLSVGAGLTNAEVAAAIVGQGRNAVDWLMELGAQFDADDSGELTLGREGGHTTHRVVHANGDATGLEIQRALTEAIASDPNITCRVGVFVRDLLVEDGRCVGAVVLGDGGELAIQANATILATGGAGQMYRETTNPAGAAGDGAALGFRAGGLLQDMEFVQFHPTTLYIAGASRFLISEVVRGAGAHLVDADGDRFMVGRHPLAELAPRDVVSRAILDRMVATRDTHVYLRLTTVEGDPHERFPTISRICRAFDIDIAKDPIPVRPGAHYLIGGLRTDLDGRTNVAGLFAVGECSSTGLHGANRLASNSLLEAAVIGRRAGAVAAEETSSVRLPSIVAGPDDDEFAPRLQLEDMLYSLKSLMWRQVGLARDQEGLSEAVHRITLWYRYLAKARPSSRHGYELHNMLTCSALVATAALEREESRGTHFRTDHPERNDAEWCRHIALSRSEDGQIAAQHLELRQSSDTTT